MEKILQWSLRATLAITTGAVLVIFDSLLFPYVTGRGVFFGFLIGAALVICAVLIAKNPHALARAASPLGLALLGYILIAVTAAIFGADSSRSFWGTIERNFGVAQLIAFGGFWFALSIAFPTKRQFTLILGASMLVGLIVCLPLLIPSLLYVSPLRPTVMGNQTFLATYAVAHFFISLLVRQHLLQRWARGLALAAGVIFLATALVTGIRAGLLGLAAGALVLAIYRIKRHPEGVKWLGLGTAGIIILFASLYALRLSGSPLGKNYAVKKLTSFSFNDPTIKSRFIMWGIAIKGWKDNPLLGTGKESYSVAFNFHFDPAFEATGLTEYWEDRPHSIFFNELIEGGLLGLGAFLAIFAIALWKSRREPILVAGLAAYIASGFFSIDTLNSYIPLILLLGYAQLQARPEQTDATHIRKMTAYWASSLAAIIGIMLIWVNFTLSRSNSAVFQTVFAVITHQPLPSVELAHYESKTIADTKSAFFAESMQIVTNHVQIQKYKDAAEIVRPDVMRAYELRPNDLRVALAAAIINEISFLADSSRKPLLEESRKIWKRLLTISPQRELFKTGLHELEQIERLYL